MLFSVCFLFFLYLFGFNYAKVPTADLLYFLSSADPVERSVAAETKEFAASEEIPVPVELEEPSKQTVEDVSADARPPESLPSLESEVVEASPVKSASTEAAPVEATLVDSRELESVPSSEESPAPKLTCEPSGTKISS